MRGNVLWALAHAAANQSASEERLLYFVEPLISIFKRTDDNPTCIIYAAMALTSICAPRATNTAMIDVITRSDVFLHISGLLQAQFPRSVDKLTIFTNVIRMLTPAIDKVCRKFSNFSKIGSVLRIRPIAVEALVTEFLSYELL